jgi:hypothetical protein
MAGYTRWGRPADSLDFCTERSYKFRDEIAHSGIGVEGAVGTANPAEGNMDVNAERLMEESLYPVCGWRGS